MFEGKARVRWCRMLRVCQNSQRLAEPTNREILFIKFLGLFIYSQNKINKIIFHQQSGFLLVRFLWPYKENELIIKKFIHFLRCFHIFINFHCRFYYWVCKHSPCSFPKSQIHIKERFCSKLSYNNFHSRLFT